ncbi:bifunctional hydroxymethylpyrimidine kinase/phosphomethylpyrimidine kinase [Enemella evansiae]|uniref:Bifunctional hydroxymethylpyrimidine kinase/phosphomethylpyrimidine kinase n=1 Tax=Enemella evansiae TaxID=2016499 RepID=A0A255GAR5_9ACTN|nr:bifunctional hydroxymethylpyrimidine kinase/phosphomethylpyrimidine kinase [Enemella evansiae]OYO10998.1 bifunctional hydroxymethylpyrimidine kinase/phosphomethylpyrimidine kinase [Enemella evansiae]OYO12935.1 bifunctional hydroxymethylpyrimidine kinase/phosphomethylpyrimidine kinase [Enemella evansiae]
MDRPVALTIAGSDPSGGAGIQADLKTFHQLGAYGTAVITALTAQNTQGVTGVHVVPAAFVAEQLETLLADVGIDAVKLGMLATAEIAETVGRFLAAEPLASAYSVLDPVMVATSGDRLVDEDATDAIRELLPLASVITPNVPEAAVLLGVEPAVDVPGLRVQAERLRSELGAQRVLLKGGHLGGEQAVDVWADEDGVREFTDERVDTKNTHGTGCTLSSALAALRPQLSDWPGTARITKFWLTSALTNGDRLEIGHGHGPVDHFTELNDTRGTQP